MANAPSRSLNAPLRSSKIQARVDLYFRLRGDPEDAPLIALTEYVPLMVNWERNRASVADTCEVELLWTDLPFDIGVIAARGALLHVWLYEHQNIKRCKSGDVGHFAGIVDGIERDLASNRVHIKARDMTALLLDAKAGEGALAKIDVANAPSLTTIVRQLMSLLPGTESWDIEELTASATAKIPQPQVRPKTPIKGRAGGPPARTFKPRFKHMASLLPGQGEVSIWDAITAVCARLGVVPEVVPSVKGGAVARVILVAAEDLHLSAVLRPFERQGRQFRTITIGRDVLSLKESLELTASAKRPDFIQVASIDRETGTSVIGEWPTSRPRKSENGMFQTVEGLTTNEDCQKLARSAWEALAQNELSAEVIVTQPWSTGGGPDDPDLLYCGYGAALRLDYEGFDRVAASASQVLEARGIPGQVAAQIATAQAKLGRLSLLFLVVTAQHQWATGSAPEYRCTLKMRRTLGGVGA